MSLVIRMARAGTKKRPFYHIVVADSRSPRDGRFIERLGYFNPLLPKEKTERLKFDLEKAKAWIAKGAQPSDRVMRFLDAAGVMKREKRNNPEKAIPRKERKAKEEAAKAAPERGSGGGRGAGRRRGSGDLTARTDGGRRSGLSRTNRRRPRRARRSPPALVHRRPGGDRRVTARSKPRTAASSRSKRCGRPKDHFVARLSGVADRNAAARLANIKLYVPRDRLPEPEEPDEFYHADLIGLDVVDRAGQRRGTVVAVHNFGAGDLIEVRPDAGGKTELVPFDETNVPVVDVAAGTDRGRSAARSAREELTATTAIQRDAFTCADFVTIMAIRFYSKSDTYREFSNFAAFGIDLDDAWWPTVENYYQAQKFADPALRKSICKAEKPPIAKSLADKNKAAIRPDWDQVKDGVMYRAVRRKFELHPELKAMLLATGDEELIELAPTDTYWGVGRDGTGLNKLGKIIARIRDELRAGAS